MKKKNLKFYLLSFVFLTIFSCGDDFTDTEPFGVLTEEQLANSVGIDLQLIGVYQIVTGVRLDGASANQFGLGPDNWWADVISDDAHKGSNNSDQADLESLETLEIFPNNSFVRARFQSLFSGVSRANAVLAAIAEIPDEDLSLQAAQARFLRGYFNFELTKFFGNVPIIDEVAFAAGEANIPNTGPAWDFIEADFTFAASNLPAQRIAGQEGIPTQGAARAFLGKAHVFQGDFAAGLTELQTVINSGEFGLHPEFITNFTLAGENGIEAVFQAQFSADGPNSPSGNRGGTLNFPGGDPFGSCCGFYMPSFDLANAYIVDDNGLPNNLDGAMILANDQGLLGEDPFTPDTTTPLDTRLDYTVGRRGIDYNGFGPHPGQPWIRSVVTNGDFSGAYLPKKNVYTADDIAAARGRGVWGQEHSGLNYNIMRYADVLLLAAEAAVEMGDLATALDYVNQVRQRAANSSPVLAEDGSPAGNYIVGLYPAFTDATSAMQAVRMERRLELAMEGQRFFDLTRWGVASDVINAYIEKEGRVISTISNNFVTPFQDFQSIMPIPLASIDLSQGVLIQNPGY